MSLSDVLLGLGIFMAGYIAGGLTGTTVQHHKITREVAMQFREARTWLDRNLAVIVAVIVLLVGASVYYDQHQRSELVQCLTNYANQNYEAQAPRQDASQALQDADKAFNKKLLTLVTDALVIHPDPSRNKQDAVSLRQALQHKQDVSDQLDAERAEKPYPQPPKEVCPQ